MKIIFLNIWGGKVYEPLMAFLHEHASGTDFFCLQEVFDSPHAVVMKGGARTDMFKRITNLLSGFAPFYTVAVEKFDGDDKVAFPLSYGNAIFAKKDIKILSHGDFFIGGEDWQESETPLNYPHKLHFLRFEKRDVSYVLMNVHGIAFPGSKRDTLERAAQSQKIVDFVREEKGEKILGGDFNLMRATQSIRMIEDAGMRNLITDFHISRTRNSFSYGQYPESDRQYFADYVFASSGIRIRNFTVPQLEISDHLPLILEIE